MASNLAYDYHNLYNKSKLYVQRALDEDREGELFPFWLSLSLELLGRSTLSKVSPTLIAETKGEESSNILYALGFETTNKPKSISTTLVFQRLYLIINELKNEAKTCERIIDQRNSELHSGLNGFEEFPVSIWLSDFYRICKILLKQNGLELSDFLGEEEAVAAEKMIAHDVSSVKKSVMDKISAFKKVFSDLTQGEKDEKIRTAKSEVLKHRRNTKPIKCPCCEENAIITGELISISEPKLLDNEIEQEKRFLPISFLCFCCNLKLNSHAELKVVEMGAQYTLKEILDPVEFHEIDVEQYIDIDAVVNQRMADEYAAQMYGDD